MPVYKADLHIHSCFSDGKPTPMEILRTSLEKGLKAISVTDHNTFKGSIEAKNILKEKKLDMVLMLGTEVRTDMGDMLVYCEEPFHFQSGIQLEYLVDIAIERGCIVIPAHPFDRIRFGIGIDGLNKILNKITAVECFNAFSSWSLNSRVSTYARDMGLRCLANSDAHTLKAIGSYYTIINAEDTLNIESFKRAIEKRSVRTETPPLPLSLYLDKMKWSIERRMKRRESC
ncbi:MAG TPA: PHP domain-containing protein [Fervidicoccus fontis]|uniref:PHP domain-containing protein n=1 Tax=Fervidicoccus fontis TaxID=683846 RepID=A0A7C2UJ51_9CREN|nr:MAG: histidinol-phosphatase [Fervidicoccus fontis]HEU97568.1 PHP domain-containing protein [Fervidicoccus fontis]